MEIKKIKKYAERKLCGENEVLRCEPIAEFGQRNGMPFEKTSLRCGCKTRKKDN